MQELAPSFAVQRDDLLREIHWSASGLWTDQTYLDLQNELYRKCLPFIEDRKGFRVLGDVREFCVQQREFAELIRESQERSAAVGVTRMAIVYSSTLVKLQFRRVSEALECEYFESKSDALLWLRRPV